MQIGYPSPATADQSLLAAPAGAMADEWTPRKYFLVLLALGISVGVVVTGGFLLGQPWVGAIVAALPIGLIVLVKPEVGLYVFAMYYPFESFGVISEYATLSKVLGIYTLLVVLIHAVRTGQSALGVSAFWFAVAFTTWSGLTVFVGQVPELVVATILTRLQMVGLIFVVLSACSTAQRARTMYWVVFIASLIVSVGGFFLTTPGTEQQAQVSRLTVTAGAISGAVSFAKAIMPGIFLVPYILGQVRRSFRPLVLGVVAVVLAAMVGSGTRSCYAGAAIGVVVVALVYRPLPVGRRILLAVGVVTAIAAFIIVGAASGLWATGLWTRVVELSQEGLASGGRGQVWLAGLQMVAEHPLLGVGIGNFPIELLRRKGIYMMGHNDFITHFAETGIPGILLYLAMLAAVLRLAWRTSEPRLRAGLIGLFVAAVIASMANPSYGEKSFWLQMALCVLGGTVPLVTQARLSVPAATLDADGRLARLPGADAQTRLGRDPAFFVPRHSRPSPSGPMGE